MSQMVGIRVSETAKAALMTAVAKKYGKTREVFSDEASEALLAHARHLETTPRETP